MADALSDRELYDKVIAFVHERTRTRKNLSPDTDIGADLGVDGDDAKEFMLKFQREFDADLSAFRFALHFGAEGFDLITAFRSAFGRKRTQPVTISVLCDAAKSGRWPEFAEIAD